RQDAFAEGSHFTVTERFSEPIRSKTNHASRTAAQPRSVLEHVSTRAQPKRSLRPRHREPRSNSTAATAPPSRLSHPRGPWHEQITIRHRDPIAHTTTGEAGAALRSTRDGRQTRPDGSRVKNQSSVLVPVAKIPPVEPPAKPGRRRGFGEHGRAAY